MAELYHHFISYTNNTTNAVTAGCHTPCAELTTHTAIGIDTGRLYTVTTDSYEISHDECNAPWSSMVVDSAEAGQVISLSQLESRFVREDARLHKPSEAVVVFNPIHVAHKLYKPFQKHRSHRWVDHYQLTEPENRIPPECSIFVSDLLAWKLQAGWLLDLISGAMEYYDPCNNEEPLHDLARYSGKLLPQFYTCRGYWMHNMYRKLPSNFPLHVVRVNACSVDRFIAPYLRVHNHLQLLRTRSGRSKYTLAIRKEFELATQLRREHQRVRTEYVAGLTEKKDYEKQSKLRCTMKVLASKLYNVDVDIACNFTGVDNDDMRYVVDDFYLLTPDATWHGRVEERGGKRRRVDDDDSDEEYSFIQWAEGRNNM